ncbi:MAG: hypothetical protein KKA07_16230 [Bacteroidetes bacterium]|nr:hypothetical protein [Bacteroidota bacterium]MBU1720613.1 hypothetical protein [Bacteroidota bacterium]
MTRKLRGKLRSYNVRNFYEFITFAVKLMIRIFPHSNTNFACPECNTGITEPERIAFLGIHTMAFCTCPSCKYQFLHDLPAGHGLTQPVCAGITEKKIHKGPKWFSNQLFDSPVSKTISATVHREVGSVIILNCLDYLYGHVLLKLLNATHYIDKHPDKGLILIIPSGFEWLVPDGTAEIWTVHAKLSDFKKQISSLDNFVQEKIKKYDSVFLSIGWSHPDPTTTDISRYSRVKSFELNNFDQLPPTITFICREDRPWIRSGCGMISFQILRLKISKKLAAGWFVRSQNCKIRRTMKRIRMAIPETEFHVVGLGNTGSFPSWIRDHRLSTIDAEAEKKWCELYSKSHIVAGIHGSNMLLPSAHAAGFIEILPDDRQGNIYQDIFSPHQGRISHFLGRFVREYVSPKEIAKTACAMIIFFERFRLNMDENGQLYGESDNLTQFESRLSNMKWQISKNKGLKKLIHNYKI